MAALARLQRSVARDLVLAPFPVAAELRTADAAHVAQAFVLDADVTTEAVVGGELRSALFTQVNGGTLMLLLYTPTHTETS